MGYFSDLAQKYIDFDYDRSYPSPEEQLLWRLDDLNYKLEELTEKDAPYRGWERLTDNDIRYDSVGDLADSVRLSADSRTSAGHVLVVNRCVAEPSRTLHLRQLYERIASVRRVSAL